MTRLPFYFAAAVCLSNCIAASKAPANTIFSVQNQQPLLASPDAPTTLFDFSIESFSISTALLASFVPLDSTQKLFVLPENPSKAILVKLVYALSSNSKRVAVFTHLVKQFAYYDPSSNLLLKGSVETFQSLSMLQKSVQNAEEYESLIEAIKEVTETHVNFIRAFNSSLPVDRLARVESFKAIILDYANLEGMFYALANFIPEHLQGHLVDFIFSAVESEDEERLAWSFYKQFASPSHFIPLPHEYFATGQSKEIQKTLVEDLIKILSRNDEDLNSAWLNQFGLLIRLRTISTSDALLFAEIISPYLKSSKVTIKMDHFNNFIRLAFIDDLISSKTPENVLNLFNSRPKKPENLDQFYVSLWNSIVSPLPVPAEDTEFTGLLVQTIKSLEMKFPGISESFDSSIFDGTEEFKSLQFIRKIDEFKFDIVTAEGSEKVIEFIEIFIAEGIKEISIKDVRFSLNLLYNKVFLEIIKIILAEDDECFDEKLGKLKLILTENLQKYLHFILNFQEISELEILINFAFCLPEISDAEKLFEFIYSKINGNAEFLSFFFEKFAEKLKTRPNFFFIRFDREEFGKFDPVTIAKFLETIKDYPLTDGTILFLTGAHINNLMTQEQLFHFLENLKLRNYLDLKFDGPEVLGFFASIADISSYEFRDESKEALLLQISNSQANAIKSLQILTSFDGETLDEFEFGLLPWLCNRIVAFEQLKPEKSETDQLESIANNLNADLLSINEAASLCAKIISHFLQFGASENDMKILFEFIKNLRKKFNVAMLANEKRTLAVTASFCLLIFIIRFDETIVPIEYALDAMAHYKLKCYRISMSQLIFKAYKDPSIRASLFPSVTFYSFDRLDHGLVHDPQVFEGMSKGAVAAILKTFYENTFLNEGIDRVRIETFCYWINLGLVPLAMTKKIIEKVGERRDRPISIKLAVGFIRGVFKQEKYKSIRTLTVQLLFVNFDHCTNFPRPFIMGIVGGVDDLIGKPEFLEALEQPAKYSQDLRAILHSELNRSNRITFDALDLSDGIENVMETYRLAIMETSSFSLSFGRKNVLLKSIFMNLLRLTATSGENDLIHENFAATLLDHFVRISIYLATQIHLDYVPPVFTHDLNPETIEIFFAAMIQFIRDSSVQTLLTFHIISAIKDRPESRGSILEIIPRFSNWRRFLLLPDSFRFIFNFGGPAELFDKFMTETIEAAFRFQDVFPTDAIDTSRSEDQMPFVNETFFSTMTFLINDFNLPAKYIIRIIDLMNQNYDSIEVISTTLVQFLRAAIKIRHITEDSNCYRITCRSYGPDCVFNSQPEIVALVVNFLRKRPDFLGMGLVSQPGTESYQLMLELELIAKNFASFDSPPVKLIRLIFHWSNSTSIDSLKLISRVYLPKHTIRSLVSWLSTSTLTRPDAAVAVAFVALDLIPSTFTIETFTDSYVSPSWLPISNSIIKWITKLTTEFPKQFGQKIEQHLIEKYFNVLLWSLEFDGKEEIVSNSLSIFLDSLNFSGDEVKYRAIRWFSSPYFRPLLKQTISTVSTNFRKFTWNNSELAKEVEKLIPFLYENSLNLTVTEDEILSIRSCFLNDLKDLEIVEDFTVLNSNLIKISSQISQIRSLQNEHDLILKFIEKLTKLAKKFYFKTPSSATGLLASYLCETIPLLQNEFILQSNSNVFLVLFKFIFKHFLVESENDPHPAALKIILNQIVSPKDIQSVFEVIIQDLRLDCCLIPPKGLPGQFYKDKNSLESFWNSYLKKLNELGIEAVAKGEVVLDGIHFITMFNILIKTEASDKLITSWIENISRIKENDIINDDFAENLKELCTKKKHFIEDLAKIYINQFFISKMFKIQTGKCKENLLAFFKIIFLQKPQLYQQLVTEKLPENLQLKMRESVGDALVERKRKFVQDFVEKCQLPVNGKIETSEIPNLTVKLETLLKFDLNLLPSENLKLFLDSLNNLIEELKKENLVKNSAQIINLMAISCSLQIKYAVPVDSDAILLVLRLHGLLKPNEEIVNLILKQILKSEHEFTRIDSMVVAEMTQKTTEGTELLYEFITKETKQRVLILETVLENEKKSDKIEIQSIVQNILAQSINKYKQQTTKSLEQFEDLAALIQLARTHKLISKTQLLLLEKLN